MKAHIFVASAALVTLSGSAFADQYYVVQGPTRHCTITTERPADRQVVTQIGPLAFATREEAENRIKQTKVCSDDTTGSGTVIRKEIDKD
jgi:hypothetical protein